jgi:ABC-type sugar transport system permease subunit
LSTNDTVVGETPATVATSRMVGDLWRLKYLPEGGVLNYLAVVWGPLETPILTDRTLLLFGAVISDVWKTTPFMALLLLAGLQTIPGEVYEAAKVDGANRIQTFFRITRRC